MYFRIRRRRFAQLAIASTVTSIFTKFATKVVAQQSSPIIYGLSFSLTTSTGSDGIVRLRQNDSPPQDTPNLSEQTPEELYGRNITELSEVANLTPRLNSITVQSTNQNVLRRSISRNETINTEVPPSQVNNPDESTEAASKAIYTEPFERITSATVLSDGKLVACVVASTQSGDFSRLVFTDIRSSNQSPTSIKISGFRETNSTVESIVELPNKQLLAIISLAGGTPPFELAIIEPSSGKVSFGNWPQLLPIKRYSNLSLSPIDGKVYATSMDKEGTITLLQLDLESTEIIERAPLTIDGKFLDEDIQSLAFAPSGVLFALGNLKQSSINTNSLLNIDIQTGQMNELTPLNVDKIAIA